MSNPVRGAAALGLSGLFLLSGCGSDDEPDHSHDAGRDAAADAATDAAHGEADAATDAGPDAAPDASVDASIDSGPEPACDDGLLNGAESDVDCGSACPVLCDAGRRCLDPTDCVSSLCTDVNLCAAATLTFEEQERALGCRPYDIAAAQLDEDGLLDVVVGCSSQGDVNIYYGVGDGTFELPVNVTMGTLPRLATAADLDGDGLPEIVSANWQSLDLSVRSNAGGRVFDDPATYATTGHVDALLLADLDGQDGADIVIADGNIGTLLNDGAGSFAEVVYGTDCPFTSSGGQCVFVPTGRLVAGQFMGGADVDVLGPSNSINLFTGGGDGTLAAGEPLGSLARSLATGDLDGDLQADVVATNANSGAQLQVLLGTGGDPPFGDPSASFPNDGGTSRNPVVADFDVDGFQDVAMAGRADDVIVLSVYGGAGDGTLADAETFPVCTDAAPVASVAGDFDGDGRTDVATACDSAGGQSGVAVARNISN